jgi:hypothetical protein
MCSVFFSYFFFNSDIIIVHMYYFFKQEEVGAGDKLVSIRLFFVTSRTHLLYILLRKNSGANMSISWMGLSLLREDNCF